jgi:hypothetical protein
VKLIELEEALKVLQVEAGTPWPEVTKARLVPAPRSPCSAGRAEILAAV